MTASRPQDALAAALEHAKRDGGYGSNYDFTLGFRRGYAAAPPPAPSGLRELAQEGAAAIHILGWGLFDKHSGTFQECPTERCVQARAALAAVDVPAEGRRPAPATEPEP